MSVNAAGRSRPTIRAVAARAGVSKSLVSLVLNESPRVSATSRAKVLAAIDDLNYTPNSQARALTQEMTGAVGVIIKDMRNPWFVDAIDGINAALVAHGLHMLIVDHHLDLRGGEASTRALTQMGVDGLITVGALRRTSALEDLVTRTPTVMTLGTGAWPAVNADIIMADDTIGVGEAFHHVYSLGHRRIAHLAVQEGEVGAARKASYEIRMEQAGLKEEILIESADNTEDGGFRAGVRLLARPQRPTAIIAYNDLTAIGALSAAKDLGLDVPGEVSIIGYDNIIIARSKTISLTTLDHATFDVGHGAVATLTERMRDPAAPTRTHLIEPELIIRRTTGPAL
jgi:DNA-binding LacI/PurR family transcriptional regulator